MFGNRNPFVNEHQRTERRQSQFERQLHACFPDPPSFFVQIPAADSLFSRLYWAVRSTQFKVLYKNEEVDETSIGDLLKFEQSERPPPLDQLLETTRHRFSQKWLKYMYAKFKNECPSGRMKCYEFKRIFGAYLPRRTSDAYLERMFKAFLHISPYPDQLTFKDLVVSLCLLGEQDARSKAEWTMRLMSGNPDGQISFTEFKEFVLSVFLLSDGDPSKRADSVITTLHTVDERSLHRVSTRASTIFKELDRSNRGFLTVSDLEEPFKQKRREIF